VGRFPEAADLLTHQRQLASGDTEKLVARLRRDIRSVSAEASWREHWSGEGHTPDYSGISERLEGLVKAGHADEALALGKELIVLGTRQVEQSHDHGETAMEVSGCMPVVLGALKGSSLDPAARLLWALDAVLADEFEVCDVFGEFLERKHPAEAWSQVADQLLTRLDGSETPAGGSPRSSAYHRDLLSNWTIHAMKRAGRKKEVIPLCETEARITGSYVRLAGELMKARRYADAEAWIREGLGAIGKEWPGVGSGLRAKLLEIRKRQKNGPVVAALKVEEFVGRPTTEAFEECRKAVGSARFLVAPQRAAAREVPSPISQGQTFTVTMTVKNCEWE